MPSVYNYSDPVSFISDYLKHIQTRDPSLSFSDISLRAGFKSSSHLIDILKRKKKISDSALKKISRIVDIDQADLMYFYVLVSKFNSSSVNKELMYDLLLNDLKPGKEDCSVFRSNEVDIFSHYVYMAILSMSELNDFELNSEYINNRLVQKLDPLLIDSAIETLLQYGLLKKDSSGRFRKVYGVISTRTDIKSEDASNYFSMACDLAKNAIDVSLDEREFQSFSLPIAKDKIFLAKEIIRKCRANLDALIEGQDKDMVYQVNLMMFPLTNKSIDENEYRELES